MVAVALLAAADPVSDPSNLPPGIWQAAAGFLTVAGLFVTAVWQWRRGKSDVEKQSGETTIALLEKAQDDRAQDRADRAELRAELSGLRERVAVLEHERQQQFLVLQAHSAWDLLAAQVIRRLLDIIIEIAPHRLPDVDDYTIGDPPPLYPPDVGHGGH